MDDFLSAKEARSISIEFNSKSCKSLVTSALRKVKESSEKGGDSISLHKHRFNNHAVRVFRDLGYQVTFDGEYLILKW